MHDRVSRYRVARLSLFPPTEDGGHARWCLTAHKIKNGIPSGSILLDGIIPGANSSPTTEELLMLFDSAIRGSMLHPE